MAKKHIKKIVNDREIIRESDQDWGKGHWVVTWVRYKNKSYRNVGKSSSKKEQKVQSPAQEECLVPPKESKEAGMAAAAYLRDE